MAITATFQANFDQFVAAVKSAETALTGVAGSAKSLGTAITASMASAEIRRFAGDVQVFAQQFIGAFAEEEAAVNKLQVALKAQGTSVALEQYTALATQFQKTTTFSDELVVSMTALLVQVGGVMPKDMQAALTAATNLSAGLGISLETATMLVAKAFGQGGEQLGKLKALLGDTVPKGADMAQVMEAINAKFGGQATAQLETYTGRMSAIKNQMSDFQEKVGKLIVDGLTPLLNAFARLPDSAQTLIVGVIAIGTAIAPLALSFASLSVILTPLVPLIGVALATAFAALLPFIGTAGLIAAGVAAVVAVFYKWDAIVGIVKSVYDGIKTWLVDRFQAIVDSIKAKIDAVTGFFKGMYDKVVGGSYIPDMIDGIAMEMGRLNDVMVQPAAQAAEEVVAIFRASAEHVVTTWGDAMSQVSQGLGTMSGTIAGAMDWGAYNDSVTKALMHTGTIDWGGPKQPKMPGFASGGPTTEGPAYVHGGEYVVPKGGALVSGGGGTTTINLVVDGRVLASVVNAHNTRSILGGQKVGGG